MPTSIFSRLKKKTRKNSVARLTLTKVRHVDQMITYERGEGKYMVRDLVGIFLILVHVFCIFLCEKLRTHCFKNFI